MDKQFYPYLYENGRISDMLIAYSTPRIKAADTLTRFEAKKVLNYWNTVKDENFMTIRVTSLLNDLDELVRTEFNSVDTVISGRIKDVFSMFNKIDLLKTEARNEQRKRFVEHYLKEMNVKGKEAQLYRATLLEELLSPDSNATKQEFEIFCHTSSFKKNPFDRIKDSCAFRMVLEDNGTGDMIDELYSIANLIIKYIDEESTFDILESSGLSDVGKLVTKSPLIHIPHKTGLLAEYQKFAKDYVYSPKPDGYQSLHISIFDPFTNQRCELQLRTRSMHIVADTHAHHAFYKKSKYAIQQQHVAEQVDYSKIHLENNHFRYYQYSDTETGAVKDYIYDSAGLTKPFTFGLNDQERITKFIETW